MDSSTCRQTTIRILLVLFLIQFTGAVWSCHIDMGSFSNLSLSDAHTFHSSHYVIKENTSISKATEMDVSASSSLICCDSEQQSCSSPHCLHATFLFWMAVYHIPTQSEAPVQISSPTLFPAPAFPLYRPPISL